MAIQMSSPSTENASRRTHDRGKDRKPLRLVSAWASRPRLVLGRQATEEKSNEITAIALLLERLHLEGAIVTIDAMAHRSISPRQFSMAAPTTACP